MAMSQLPQLLVMKSPSNGYVYYEKKEGEDVGGSVRSGENSVFKPAAKMEVEQAKSNKSYVHLRFCYSNRYWQKATKGGDLYRLVAESNQPIEDTSDPSCTLFEPFSGPSIDVFYLRHVQTGRLVLFSGDSIRADENADATPKESSGHYFNAVECETLIQLPEHVALMGNNEKYLKAYSIDREGKVLRLHFGETDPNNLLSGHTVQQLPDGHVRMLSDFLGKYWRFDTHTSWICPDSSDTTPHDDNTLFWPVKIDNSGTIALRSKTGGKFCNRRSADGNTDFQAATDDTITAEAKMRVEELVLERKIYYVDYKMEDARIFDEEPYLAGTAHLINATGNNSSESVTIAHLDEKSYTFSRGFSITSGVKTTIETKIPFIVEGKVEVSLEVSGNFQWDTTTTTTTSVSATGTVEVPAKSSVIVEYVGTRGTCNIPYSYTQLDKSATDGKVKRTEMTDGTYTGVSCYNFSFKMSAPQSII